MSILSRISAHHGDTVRGVGDGPARSPAVVRRVCVSGRPEDLDSYAAVTDPPGTRDTPRPHSTVSIVPIAHVDDVAKEVLEIAASIKSDKLFAVHVCDRQQQSETKRFEREWMAWSPNVTMVFLDGWAGSVAAPIRDYLKRRHEGARVNIFVTRGSSSVADSSGISHHHANQLEGAFRKVPHAVIWLLSTRL